MCCLQSVASDWTDRYQEEDAEKAMMELVQYFVLCCGCRATITMEMFQNEETTHIIRSLTENFDEVLNFVTCGSFLCFYNNNNNNM